MNAETKARLFEPFYTTKDVGHGSGLGLAVVHNIVMTYGGAICLDSEPGVGTTFEIYLPLAETAPELEAEGQGGRDDVRGSERILVVDDDSDLAQVLTIGLRRYGYDVTSLTDPKEALNTVAQSPEQWDLVVSDQMMPGMTGLTLISRLKELRPALRAVLYTGFDEGVAAGGVASLQGVDALILKPVAPQELATRIRQLLDG
jgi:CheY-like chemotaxis protein